VQAPFALRLVEKVEEAAETVTVFIKIIIQRANGLPDLAHIERAVGCLGVGSRKRLPEKIHGLGHIQTRRRAIRRDGLADRFRSVARLRCLGWSSGALTRR
jgi:hypothetical protein